MSQSTIHAVPNANPPRRLIRSCDNCRQRKIRCNGSSMADNHCSSCLASGEPCTYVLPPGKPGPRNKLVQELKQKIAVLEARLRTLSVCSLCSQPLQSTLGTNRPTSNNFKSEETLIEDSQENEEDVAEELGDQFRRWQLTTVYQSTPKFFGSASHINLLQNALTVKQEFLGRPLKPNLCLRRPIFWNQFPWERELYTRRKSYSYPPRDLMDHLFELYFANIHPIFPVLHRNSFTRLAAEGFHLTNPSFGAVVLAVMALASRYSNDPRVMVDGNPLSSGWSFVAQVPIVTNVFDPCVYDVQFYCLMTLYSLGGSTPHIIWVYMGLAVRFVQFHGPYLRRRDGHKLEDELWNRTFWAVFLVDILLSSYLGRPPAIHAEEYDVDPPLEVDDDYWETGFVQPTDKPSALSFFVHFVRLFEILGNALSRLFASKRLKMRRGWTPEWEKEIVAELDSLLNDFMESIPPHLRWDPDGHGIFFEQSALLHSTYHWIRLTIHRPYMQSKSPRAGISLFICVTAARSALGVASVWASRGQCIPPPFLQNPVFISAVILLLNIFATKRAGVSLDFDKDFAHVQAAIEIFKGCEARSQGSGRLWELLQDLQSMDGYLSMRVPTQNTAHSDVAVATPVRQSSRNDSSLNSPSPLVSEITSRVDLGFRPGVSIEQLLADTRDSANGSHSADSLDTEVTSLWLAAPDDLMNIDQWDAYIDNMAVTDPSWSSAT